MVSIQWLCYDYSMFLDEISSIEWLFSGQSSFFLKYPFTHVLIHSFKFTWLNAYLGLLLGLGERKLKTLASSLHTELNQNFSAWHQIPPVAGFQTLVTKILFQTHLASFTLFSSVFSALCPIHLSLQHLISLLLCKLPSSVLVEG